MKCPHCTQGFVQDSGFTKCNHCDGTGQIEDEKKEPEVRCYSCTGIITSHPMWLGGYSYHGYCYPTPI
jgi:hypothetical protein